MHSNQVAYKIRANVHYVPSTCEQVDCQRYREGWQSAIDESTSLGQGQAHYIRHDSGRSFREYTAAEWNEKMRHRAEEAGEKWTDIPNSMTVFSFAPGQRCFKSDEHQRTEAHTPLFLVGGREGLIRKHSNADSWADDLRTHQDNILGKLD